MEEKADFIIQCLDGEITSAKAFELKDSLDKDYKYIVGIAISDVHCSDKSVLEIVKIKGMELLPENFEVSHLLSSKSVAPNKRFFSWFKPMEVSGDDITIKFRDPDFADPYNLQVQILLTNNPKQTRDVLFA